MEQAEWQALLAKLDSIPLKVVWDVREPVQQFRRHLGTWENAQTFTEQVINLILDCAGDPLNCRDFFVENLGVIYSDYGALEAPVTFYELCDCSQALGIDLLGRLHFLGFIGPKERLLYRFEDMLQDDVVLRRVNLTELEEMYHE